MTTQSFNEYFESGASLNAPYAQSFHIAGSMNLGVGRVVNNPAGHYPDPPMDEFLITLITKGSNTSMIDLGVRPITVTTRKGQLVLAPPDTQTDYQIDGSFDLTMASLPKSVFQTAQDAIGEDQNLNLEQMHSEIFRDPLVEQLVLSIHSEAQDGAPHGALFVDHAVHTLTARLLTLAGRLTAKSHSAKPLDDILLARVSAMVEDRIDEKITLDELAAPTGWDVYRFTRAFRNAVGQTPHQYVLSRRIERACDQLAATQDPLAEIAYAVGFSSQQHMTNMFSKHVGVSPAKYRLEAAR